MRWSLLALALVALAAPSPARAGAAGPGHRALGLTAVRVTLGWQPGWTKLDADSATYVARAQAAARLGERVVLAVYGPAATPPADAGARGDFCSFVVAALGAARNVYDVVIWNEANSAFLWRPQQGAAAQYEALLETCYDAVRKARKNMNVISSLAPHESPARLVRDLGAAYRAGGRTAPIFDTFGYDAYPETSNESPLVQHSGPASMDEGDYGALVSALAAAFGGAGQRVPGSGGTTPGSVPPGGVPAAAAYTGRETNTLLVPALIYRPVAGGPARDQSSQLRDAIELAYCQPAVGAFFNFQLADERDLAGWHSGLQWADGTKKPSHEIVRQAIAAVAAASVDCSQLPRAATGLP
jgi:hypothetical protein